MNYTKQELRDHFRSLRASVPTQLRDTYTRSMATHFSAEKKFEQCASIAGYIAIRDEAEPGFLIEYLFSENKNIYLPKMNIEKQLNFISYSGNEKLHKNKYGVMEPENNAAGIPDLILLPLLAYDADGYRLGYGGGYYDRTLARPEYEKTLRVGVGYVMQKCEALPHEAHDVRLHAVLTEEGVVWFR